MEEKDEDSDNNTNNNLENVNKIDFNSFRNAFVKNFTFDNCKKNFENDFESNDTNYKTLNSIDENYIHQKKLDEKTIEKNVEFESEKIFKITKNKFNVQKENKIFKIFNEEKKLNSKFNKFVIKYVNDYVKSNFKCEKKFLNVNGNPKKKTDKKFLKNIFNNSIENFIKKKGVSQNFYKNDINNNKKYYNQNLLDELKNENNEKYNNFFTDKKIKEIFEIFIKNIQKNYKNFENNFSNERYNFVLNYLKYLEIE